MSKRSRGSKCSKGNMSSGGFESSSVVLCRHGEHNARSMSCRGGGRRDNRGGGCALHAWF